MTTLTAPQPNLQMTPPYGGMMPYPMVPMAAAPMMGTSMMGMPMPMAPMMPMGMGMPMMGMGMGMGMAAPVMPMPPVPMMVAPMAADPMATPMAAPPVAGPAMATAAAPPMAGNSALEQAYMIGMAQAESDYHAYSEHGKYMAMVGIGKMAQDIQALDDKNYFTPSYASPYVPVDQTFTGSAWGTLVGGDRVQNMEAGEVQRRTRRDLAERLAVGANAFMTEGLAPIGTGALGGMIGSAMFPGIGSIVGMLGGAILGDTILNADSLRKYFQRGSFFDDRSRQWMRPGQSTAAGGTGFNRQETAEALNFLEALSDRDAFFSPEEMDKMVVDLADQGLFDTARSVDDFKRKFARAKENLQVVMEQVGVGIEEGTQLLGDLSRIGIEDTDVAVQLRRMEMAGARAGLSGREAIDWAVQTGGRIFTGTGIDLGRGVDLQTDNLAHVGTLESFGAVDRQTLLQLGGTTGAATTLTQFQMRSLQSTPVRRALMAAYTGSGTPDEAILNQILTGQMSVGAQANLARQTMNDPQNYLQFAADLPEMLSSMTANQMRTLSAVPVLNYVEALRKRHPNLEATPALIKNYLTRTLGLSMPQAELVASSFLDVDQDDLTRTHQAEQNEILMAGYEQGGLWGRYSSLKYLSANRWLRFGGNVWREAVTAPLGRWGSGMARDLERSFERYAGLERFEAPEPIPEAVLTRHIDRLRRSDEALRGDDLTQLVGADHLHAVEADQVGTHRAGQALAEEGGQWRAVSQERLVRRMGLYDTLQRSLSEASDALADPGLVDQFRAAIGEADRPVPVLSNLMASAEQNQQSLSDPTVLASAAHAVAQTGVDVLQGGLSETMDPQAAALVRRSAEGQRQAGIGPDSSLHDLSAEELSAVAAVAEGIDASVLTRSLKPLRWLDRQEEYRQGQQFAQVMRAAFEEEGPVEALRAGWQEFQAIYRDPRALYQATPRDFGEYAQRLLPPDVLEALQAKNVRAGLRKMASAARAAEENRVTNLSGASNVVDLTSAFSPFRLDSAETIQYMIEEGRLAIDPGEVKEVPLNQLPDIEGGWYVLDRHGFQSSEDRLAHAVQQQQDRNRQTHTGPTGRDHLPGVVTPQQRQRLQARHVQQQTIDGQRIEWEGRQPTVSVVPQRRLHQAVEGHAANRRRLLALLNEADEDAGRTDEERQAHRRQIIGQTVARMSSYVRGQDDANRALYDFLQDPTDAHQAALIDRLRTLGLDEGADALARALADPAQAETIQDSLRGLLVRSDFNAQGINSKRTIDANRQPVEALLLPYAAEDEADWTQYDRAKDLTTALHGSDVLRAAVDEIGDPSSLDVAFEEKDRPIRLWRAGLLAAQEVLRPELIAHLEAQGASDDPLLHRLRDGQALTAADLTHRHITSFIQGDAPGMRAMRSHIVQEQLSASDRSELRTRMRHGEALNLDRARHLAVIRQKRDAIQRTAEQLAGRVTDYGRAFLPDFVEGWIGGEDRAAYYAFAEHPDLMLQMAEAGTLSAAEQSDLFNKVRDRLAEDQGIELNEASFDRILTMAPQWLDLVQQETGLVGNFRSLQQAMQATQSVSTSAAQRRALLARGGILHDHRITEDELPRLRDMVVGTLSTASKPLDPNMGMRTLLHHLPEALGAERDEVLALFDPDILPSEAQTEQEQALEAGVTGPSWLADQPVAGTEFALSENPTTGQIAETLDLVSKRQQQSLELMLQITNRLLGVPVAQ